MELLRDEREKDKGVVLDVDMDARRNSVSRVSDRKSVV